MEDLLVGQVIKINSKRRILSKFIKNNRFKLLIGIISMLFLIMYIILLYQFINVIQMI